MPDLSAGEAMYASYIATDGRAQCTPNDGGGQIEIILLCLITIEESAPTIVRTRTPISEINLLINIPSLRE